MASEFCVVHRLLGVKKRGDRYYLTQHVVVADENGHDRPTTRGMGSIRLCAECHRYLTKHS